MKKMFLMLAVIASTSAAQAAPLYCFTSADHNGSSLSVNVTQQNPTTPAFVDIRQNGGMAHYIRMVAKFPVLISHIGPETAVYSQPSKQFEMTVNFERINTPYFYGTLNMELDGRRLSESVSCLVARM
jgi:hypothetical protein